MKDKFVTFTTNNLRKMLKEKKIQIVHMTAIEDLERLEQEIEAINQILKERNGSN